MCFFGPEVTPFTGVARANSNDGDALGGHKNRTSELSTAKPLHAVRGELTERRSIKYRDDEHVRGRRRPKTRAGAVRPFPPCSRRRHFVGHRVLAVAIARLRALRPAPHPPPHPPPTIEIL